MGEGVVPYAVDDLAKALYRKMRGEGAQWHGRGTNRAYYRRLARAELSRQALSTPDALKGDAK